MLYRWRSPGYIQEMPELLGARVKLLLVPHAHSFIKGSMLYRWRPPGYIQEMPESKHEKIRKKWHILVEGEDKPPPIKTLKEM